MDMLLEIIDSYCDGCKKNLTTCSNICELWKFNDFLSGSSPKGNK